MKEIYIHVGLHKTGTSFLQKNVFPKMKEVNFISVFNTKIIGNKNFILCSKLSDSKINLVSDEALSEVPFSNEITDNRYQIAKRLKRLYPNAKIIVTFRNENEWINSIFKQYQKHERKRMDISFDTWYNTIFDKSLLDFVTYEKLLRDLFPDVLVLDYKELKENPDEYIKKICQFMKVTFPDYNNELINKSLSDKTSKRLQKLNNMMVKLKFPYYLKWFIRRIIKKIN